MSDPLILLCSNEWDNKWPKLVVDHLLALGLGSEYVQTCTPDELGKLSSAALHGVESARLAILLVSPEFLASRSLMKEALPRLVIRANVKVTRGQTGDTEFLPVILKECQWGLLPTPVTVQVTRELQQPLEKRDPREIPRALAYVARRAREHLIHIAALPPSLDWHAPPDSFLALQHLKTPLPTNEHVDRDATAYQLSAAWMNPRIRVVNLVGEAGVGKSTLLASWLQHLARDQWRGAEQVFCWSFQQQAPTGRKQSADECFYALRQLLCDVDDAPEAWWETGARLAQLIHRQRMLVVLDDLDPLLRIDDQHNARITDDAILVFLRKLLMRNEGLCVVASQRPLAELSHWEEQGLVTMHLDRLSPAESKDLLTKLKYPSSTSEIDDAAAASRGHPIAARLVAGWRLAGHHGASGSLATSGAVSSPSNATPGISVKRSTDVIRLMSIAGPSLLESLLREFLQSTGDRALEELLVILALADRPLELATIERLISAFPSYFEGTSPQEASTTPFGHALGMRDQQQLQSLLANLRVAGVLAHPNTSTVHLQPALRAMVANRIAPSCPELAKWIHRQLQEQSQLQITDGPMTPPRLAMMIRVMRHAAFSEHYQEALYSCFLEPLWKKDDLLGAETMRDFCHRSRVIQLLVDPTTKQPYADLAPEDRWEVARMNRRALRSVGAFAEAIDAATRDLLQAKSTLQMDHFAECLTELSQLLLIVGRVKEATTRVNELFAFPSLQQHPAIFRDAVNLSARVLHLKGKFAEAMDRYQLGASLSAGSSRLIGAEHWRVEAVFDSGNFPQAEKAAWREIEHVSQQDCAASAGYRILLGRLYLALRTHSGDWRYREEASKHVHLAGTLARKSGLLEMILPAQLAAAAVHRNEARLPQAAELLTDVTLLTQRCGLKLLAIDCHIEQLFLRLASGATVDVFEQLAPLRQRMTDLLYGRMVRDLRALEAKFVVSKSEGSSASP